LTGGLSTNDSLVAQGVGGLVTTSTTMQSIENLLFAANTGAGAVIDLSNTTGIRNITLTASVDAANSVIGINAGIQSITLNTSAAAAATTYTLGFANAAMSGAADAIALNVSGLGTPVTGAAASVRDTITLNPTSGTGAFETVNLTTSGGTTSTIALNSTAGGNTTLNIAGTGVDVTINDTLTTTINASTSTGGVVIGVAAGSGIQTITGGAGNDRINLGTTYTTADVIDGGAGRDIVQMATADLITTTARTNLANIEVVGNTTALGGGTVTLANWGAGVNGFRLGGAANAPADAFFDGSSGVIAYGAATAATLDLAGGEQNGQTLTVTADAASVTDTISISSGSATGNSAPIVGGVGGQGTIVATNFEVVNVASLTSAATYTAITLAPSAGSLGTVNFTGSVAINGGTVTAGIVTGAAMTGAATLTATLGAAGSLTGTANNDVLTGSAGADAINGGAGNDVLTGAAGIDTINLGTGTDTVVLPGTLAANIAANRDTVIGFNTGAGGDVVNISAAAAGATTYVEFIAPAATYTVSGALSAANALRNVNEFAFNTATPTTAANSLDATLGGANALDGTNLLLAIGNGAAAVLSVATTDFAGYIVAYQNGNAYLYYFREDAAAGVVVDAGEINLVGTFNGVTAGSFDVANFL
jgi:S-layer protein